MLTIGAASVSALAGFVRYQTQRKKDRVDVFYNKILELRSQVSPALRAEQVNALAEQVRQVQQEVFGLLVDERVDANETMTLFLDLSNQVLSELAEIGNTRS